MNPVDNETKVNPKNILNINVGILGHVDSGKTSLVKALSTQLSTAALDKNPQSQQRGITLDLGFSAFTLSIPDHLSSSGYDLLQFTLVDCPGHASLIRTIIGGAQIIDMMLLVIDANKGIQTQTAECIVIGEITTDKLIIVLNKIDMIPEIEREQKLEKVSKRIKKVFASTKFSDSPIVCTSASVGGEKIASVSINNSKPIAQENASNNIIDTLGIYSNTSSYGINELVTTIRRSVTIPHRHIDHPFYYAIDHCFSIRGHGTVVTGTVLSGTVKINQLIEFPELQKQKKVKSMQMFKKSVKVAHQGDRVGICIADLDPKSIERGIAAAPNSVPLLHNVICLVKKVRFFKFICRSNSKFHVSVGHTTVIANVTFFGASELSSSSSSMSVSTNMTNANDNNDNIPIIEKAASDLPIHNSTTQPDSTSPSTYTETISSSSSSSSLSYHRHFPSPSTLTFNWTQDFLQQNELIGTTDGDLIYGHEPLQWYCHISLLMLYFIIYSFSFLFFILRSLVTLVYLLYMFV